MKRAVFGLTILVSALFIADPVFAADFSAEMVSTTKEGTVKGKVFISGVKTRMEMDNTITISRVDVLKVWMLMPQDQLYIEMPLENPELVGISERIPGEINRVLLGTEELPGQGPAEKYEVEYKIAGEMPEKVLLWIDRDSRIPVKTAALDNSWTVEYKDIKIEKQEESLFEIPAGYKPLSTDLSGLGYE